MHARTHTPWARTRSDTHAHTCARTHAQTTLHTTAHARAPCDQQAQAARIDLLKRKPGRGRITLELQTAVVRGAFSNIPLWHALMDDVGLALGNLRRNSGLFARAPVVLRPLASGNVSGSVSGGRNLATGVRERGEAGGRRRGGGGGVLPGYGRDADTGLALLGMQPLIRGREAPACAHDLLLFLTLYASRCRCLQANLVQFHRVTSVAWLFLDVQTPIARNPPLPLGSCVGLPAVHAGGGGAPARAGAGAV